MKKNTNFDSKSLMLIKKLKNIINQNDRTKEGWKEKGSCLTKMKKIYLYYIAEKQHSNTGAYAVTAPTPRKTSRYKFINILPSGRISQLSKFVQCASWSQLNLLKVII